MGIFSKKPSREDQAALRELSESVLSVLNSIAIDGSIRLPSGLFMDLNDSQQRDEVASQVDVLLSQIKSGGPLTGDKIKRRAAIISDYIDAHDWELGPYLVGGLNFYEMICFERSYRYPKWKPLAALIGQS